MDQTGEGWLDLIGLERGLDQAIGRGGGSLPHEDHERGIARGARLNLGIVSLGCLEVPVSRVGQDTMQDWDAAQVQRAR